MSARAYDVVLYGASGFTGQQTVAYFASRGPGGGLRWAVAGRDREKLRAVRAQVGGTAAEVDILVADSHDQAAVDAMVSQTRVLLSTAGPFALYGTGVVDACVRFGTHYVDITGETPWVRDLIDRYHEKAASEGIRIIPFCGFDSVPSDLGAFLVARQIQRTLGVSCAEVRAYYQLYGGFNGGTLATLLNLYESGASDRMQDPFLLNPGVPPSQHQIARSRDAAAPRYDPEVGAWVGPFLMAGINTRVVRRSAGLFEAWGEPYGPEFVYGEYQRFDPPLARGKAYGLSAGLVLFEAALRRSLGRRLLRRVLPSPGTGPDPQTMERGWFRCVLVGTAADGRRIRGLIRHQGDPGNRATVTFLCEAALCLAEDGDRLPGGPERGGVLTPATALGERLAERLRERGVTLRFDASAQA